MRVLEFDKETGCLALDLSSYQARGSASDFGGVAFGGVYNITPYYNGMPVQSIKLKGGYKTKNSSGQNIVSLIDSFALGFDKDWENDIDLTIENVGVITPLKAGFIDLSNVTKRVKLTINYIGSNMVYAKDGIGKPTIIANDIVIKSTYSSASFEVKGSNGKDGVTVGANGANGDSAIVANNITIDTLGMLTAIGGDGGNGVNGKNGNNGSDRTGKNQSGDGGENGGNGGNGGDGGDGGHSITASKLNIVKVERLLLQGGRGGNGGNGGHGSDDRGGAGGYAGNGGKGGNGGNGGSVITAQKAVIDSGVQLSVIKITSGLSGAGGNGGNGGNGGKPGKNTWFSYKGGIPRDGGAGGNGGNGGTADDTFKSAFTDTIVKNADTEGSVGLLGIGGKGGSKSEWSGDGNGDDGEAKDGANGSDGSGCRDKQEITYNKHRYVLMIGRLSWTKAKQYAEDCGGHLATVTSVGENSVLKQMVIYSGLSGVWLGAENTSGSYVWVTGEKWDYTCWAPSEPSGGEEHYLGYYKTGGNDWNDYKESTDTVVGFIVEFE